jgi:hypothetical protein
MCGSFRALAEAPVGFSDLQPVHFPHTAFSPVEIQAKRSQDVCWDSVLLEGTLGSEAGRKAGKGLLG